MRVFSRIFQVSVFMLVGCATFVFADTLTLYSARSKHLIAPFIKQYTDETGVNVNYLTDKDPVLLTRLKMENKTTLADVLLTVDAGSLWKAKQDGLLQPVQSKRINQQVPDYLRDQDNQWFALTIRARTIVYSPERVKLQELDSYATLANSEFSKRLCLRTSKKVYNQSLVAMMIEHHGMDRTAEIVRGWVNNLAQSPYAKDSHVIGAIASGKCDVGLVNSYYYGREIKKDPKFGDKVKLYWANQGENSYGTHINISGIGVTKYAKNPKAAIHFIEWLTSERIQNKFASKNLEYPVNANASMAPLMKIWGTFKQDKLNLNYAGINQVKAVKLMDRAGYK